MSFVLTYARSRSIRDSAVQRWRRHPRRVRPTCAIRTGETRTGTANWSSSKYSEPSLPAVYIGACRSRPFPPLHRDQRVGNRPLRVRRAVFAGRPTGSRNVAMYTVISIFVGRPPTHDRPDEHRDLRQRFPDLFFIRVNFGIWINRTLSLLHTYKTQC